MNNSKEVKQKSYYKLKNTARNRAKFLWSTAKNKCLKRKLEFNLNLDRLVNIIKNGCCEVTGIEFDLTPITYNPFAPSLDRIDPNKPYTDDNVQIVVWIYNRAKGNSSHEDVMKMVKALSWSLEKN